MEPFPYFQNPRHPLSTWTKEPTECDICEAEAPGFEGPYYGEEDIDHVCEACLRAGRLAELDCSANEGDTRALRAGLGKLSPAEAEAVESERSLELTTRTPHLTTWQDLLWPAHCGDFCQFVEELGKPEIRELAGDTDPQQWLVGHLRDEFPEGAWDAIRQNSAREFPSESYDLTVYRFDCRACSEMVLHWDCN